MTAPTNPPADGGAPPFTAEQRAEIARMIAQALVMIERDRTERRISDIEGAVMSMIHPDLHAWFGDFMAAFAGSPPSNSALSVALPSQGSAGHSRAGAFGNAGPPF